MTRNYLIFDNKRLMFTIHEVLSKRRDEELTL